MIVTAAEPSALDLLLTAARRRMADSAFAFPKRVATRRNGPSDAEIPITRNLFRQVEQEGGFVAIWRAGGHSFGLPDSLRQQLLDGRPAVIAAPGEVVSALNEMCADVRVVRLTGQLDAALAPLTRGACLRRIVGSRLAERLEARGAATRLDDVAHADDVPSAVRALTEALVRIEREHRVLLSRGAIGSDAGPQARDARFRRAPGLTPVL